MAPGVVMEGAEEMAGGGRSGVGARRWGRGARSEVRRRRTEATCDAAHPSTGSPTTEAISCPLLNGTGGGFCLRRQPKTIKTGLNLFEGLQNLGTPTLR